jgi:pyruvate kinase
MLREACRLEGRVVGVLGDLAGPKIRIESFRDGPAQLVEGQPFALDTALDPQAGNAEAVGCAYKNLPSDVAPGDTLLLNDGLIILEVTGIQGSRIDTRVVAGGELSNRKGVNRKGGGISAPALTDKDREDIRFAAAEQLDYVALSFVRDAADVKLARELLAEAGSQARIVAKIERQEAIAQLAGIVDAADVVMVARGDLGVEIPIEEIAILQKRIMARANLFGKPVITATQMLESMAKNRRPTRAEATDVANAILDGTDAVMLSGETATGKYPVEAVLMMKQIAEIMERAFPYDQWRRSHLVPHVEGNITEAISDASCAIAEEIGAAAIVSTTLSGWTAQQVARFRPRSPILAVSPSAHTQRRLALVWGVETLLVPDFQDTDTMLEQTIQAVRRSGLEPGRRVVITGGVPFGKSGQTNLIKIHTV